MASNGDANSVFKSLTNHISEIKSQKYFIVSLFERSFFGSYKNTHLGFLWNFASPVIYLVLTYIIATELRGRDSDFIILLASGIFVYHILIGGVTRGTTCFTSAASMIKKMYFPREILVLVHVLINLVVALICYAILFIVIFILGFGVDPLSILLFFPIIFISVLFSIGCSLLLSSLTVYVRDIQYGLAGITLVFYVLTPLRDSIYEIGGLREELMWLNPFTYFVEPMHQIFYFKTMPDFEMLLIASIASIVVLVLGIAIFSYLKSGFVERL